MATVHPVTGGAYYPQLDQPEQPDSLRRRGLGSFLRPRNEQTIALIQEAISRGLDPQVGLSLLQGVGADVQGRYGAYQERRATQRAETQAEQAALPGQLSEIAGLQAGGVPQQAVQTAYGQGLEGLIGQVYGGGAGGGQTLSNEELQTIYGDAINFATGNYDAPIPTPLSLHDARMRIMGALRTQNYSEAELARAYDAIGRAYQAVGGRVGTAPVTGGPAPGAPPAAPAGAGGGGAPLSLWEQLQVFGTGAVSR